MRVVYDHPCIQITPSRKAITCEPLSAFSDEELEYYANRVSVGLARNKAADAVLRCKGTLALVVDPNSLRPVQRYKRFTSVVIAIDASSAYGLTADNEREELKGPFGSWRLQQLKWDVSWQLHSRLLLHQKRIQDVAWHPLQAVTSPSASQLDTHNSSSV
jgi:hypothetical protein